MRRASTSSFHAAARACALTVLLLCAGPAFAQNGQRVYVQGDSLPRTPSGRAPVIAGFAVIGNEQTESETILRELTVHVGDTVDAAEIDYSESRVYSLGLFNRVEISYPPLDSTVLLVEVEERWYIYPVPILTMVDRDWSQWNYGLGVKHDNFRGRNEKLWAGFALGWDPWASASYNNPWMFGSAQMFTDLSVSWSRAHNKSLDVEGDPNYLSTRIGAGITVGKRFDPFRSVWVSYAYQSTAVSEYQPGRTISPSGLDYYSTFAVGARHDTRNMREYATNGMYSMVTLSKKGFGVSGVDMFTVYADVRGYLEVWRGVAAALRGLTQLSGGPGIPSYEHAFLGYGERIRGHFTTRFEGDDLAAVFAELRVPVLSPRYLVVPQIPIRQFSTWRLGLYVTAFADMGVTWYKNDRPDWAHAPQGYGVGLNFLLPYSTVLRLEHAWNEHGAGEWIIDLNAAL